MAMYRSFAYDAMTKEIHEIFFISNNDINLLWINFFISPYKF